MKQYLIAFTMLFFIGSTVVSAQKHRQRHTSATATVKDTTPSQAAVAYSDTLSVVDSAATSSLSASQRAFSDDIDEHDIANILGGSEGRFFMKMVLLSVALFILLLPLSFLIIIYFWIRRYNDKVKLAEKAIDKGQPTASKDVFDSQTGRDEVLWRRGVKNVAVGVGLIFMFITLDAVPVSGVGVLMLCYGFGQIYIARNSYTRGNKKQGDRQGNNLYDKANNDSPDNSQGNFPDIHPEI